MIRLARTLPAALLMGSCLAAPLAQAATFDGKVLDDALSERRDGEVYRAINALQKMLGEVPDADRVKLELAVAYLQAGIFEEAERLAGEVKESEGVPEAVLANIDAFLELTSQRKTDAEENPHKFSYEFALFLADDDNVNNGIDADVVDNNVATPASLRDRDATSTGTRITVNHVYSSPSSGEFRGKPSKLFLESQAFFYNKFHSGDSVDDFELTVISFGTGPVLRVSNGLSLRAKVRADYIEQGGDHLATFYTISPGVTIPIGPGSLVADGLIQAREYGSNSSSGRQGQRYGGSLAYTMPLGWGMRASAGVFYYTQTAKQQNQEHDADGYHFDWQWRLAQQWRLYAEYRHKESDFEGIEPIIGKARETEEDRITAGVDLAVNNWLFGVQWLDISVDANGQAFEYDREVLQASAALRFD